MAGKSMDDRFKEALENLEKRETELKAELLEITAKKGTLQSFLNLEDPGERILTILFEPSKVLIPAKPPKQKVAAHATEKPFADMTIGSAVCHIMDSGHNRRRHTAADLAEKIVDGGWRGRKGRATAVSIRPKVSEILNDGYGDRSFKKVSRGVFTV